MLADDGSWFVNIKEHCEDGQRSLYVKDLTIAHVRRWGWRFVDELVWCHQGLPGKYDARFKNQFEPVFHFARGNDLKFRPRAVSHDSDAVPWREPGDPGREGANGNIACPSRSEPGLAYPGNVVKVAPGGNGAHAAAFPVGLPEFFIKAFSDDGDVIFDPFMGSGSTMIAAEKTNRSALGIEISPAYCDVIVERWETFTGEKAVRRGYASGEDSKPMHSLANGEA